MKTRSNAPRKKKRTLRHAVGRAWKPATDETRVYELAKRGATEEIIARVLFNLSPGRFREKLAHEPVLSDAYKRGFAERGMQLVTTAYNLAVPLAKQGKAGLLIFLLKTKHGFRETMDLNNQVTLKPHESFAHAVQQAPKEVRDYIEVLPDGAQRRLVEKFHQPLDPVAND